MPSSHVLVGFTIALVAAVSIKVALSAAGRNEGLLDEVDLQVLHKKRGRMERGECIYCAEPLSNGRVASTLTSSMCPRCAPDSCV